MDIHLYNTLTKKKELFTPITPHEVSMYHCGPTVYNYAHIGNLKPYIFSDIIRRVFEINGYKVHQIINITDIGHLTSDADEGEDKMTKALLREEKPLTLESMRQLGDFYAERFKEDLVSLHIEIPAAFPKASEHIDEEINLIKKLDEKGYVYTTSDGVYFDTSKYSSYGKLGGIHDISVDEQHARIASNSEKKNPRDFALWKFNTELGWESPWGKGFPGWHIECSAMSMKYLGETFDIHTGGIDHIPVHHNNEIAQSEAATEKPFVHYWLHQNFLIVNDQKISKSLQNDIYLSDIKEKGISPLAYRYFLLTSHYRTLVNFTMEALEAAHTAFNKLIQSYASLGDSIGKIDENYINKFLSVVNDDFNTPKAIALVWDLLKDQSISSENKKATLLEFDKVLGFGLKDIIAIPLRKEVITIAGQKRTLTFSTESDISKEVKNFLVEREQARVGKEWSKADEIRDKIRMKGFTISDDPDGVTIK